jgi:transcriptional pleiotropic regulator of transition state genes
MKSTGIVRKVDELGRIVIPIELRRTLNFETKDSLEIYVDEGKIIFKKYQPACIFCNDAADIINFKGKNICPDCLEEISENLEQIESA